MLSGVSVDYYVRLERGNLSGASDGVLDGVARALQLDDAEREHLFDLARRPTGSTAARRKTPARRLRPALQQMLDAIGDAPAWIRNDRHDLLATNRMARALYAPILADPNRRQPPPPGNVGRHPRPARPHPDPRKRPQLLTDRTRPLTDGPDHSEQPARRSDHMSHSGHDQRPRLLSETSSTITA